MARTTDLRIVDEYIFEKLKTEFNEVLKRKKLTLNNNGFKREFSGVSKDGKIVVQTCHSSGLTKTGNIPSGKLDRILMRCLLLDKTDATTKRVIFTNHEFKSIFERKCGPLFKTLNFDLFDNFPAEYQMILDDMIEESSNENG